MKNSGWTSGKPVETEKRLLISLMLTLGEWCMRLPVESLTLSSDNGKSSLLTSIFEVLHMVSVGYQSAGENSSVKLTSLEDFDPSIPFDDLQVRRLRFFVFNMVGFMDLKRLSNYVPFVKNIDPSLRSLGKENVFVRPESTNSSQDIETVRLSARSVTGIR